MGHCYHNYQYKKHLKPIARGLRKRMSEAEVRLWVRIRRKQINNLRFHRQRPIGKYIVDFYCPKRKLIIEADGVQHNRAKDEKQDRQRDEYFNKMDIRVLRFSNYEIFNNIDGVIETIIRETLNKK